MKKEIKMIDKNKCIVKSVKNIKVGDIYVDGLKLKTITKIEPYTNDTKVLYNNKNEVMISSDDTKLTVYVDDRSDNYINEK